jgi:ABC-2 type transport system ATP-binding protein
VIRLRATSFSYGSRVVLDAIDARFPPGVSGLLGANGAGKTTLLRLLAGILRQDGGSMEYHPEGRHQSPDGGVPSLGANVGYLPQVTRATRLLTARSYVEYAAYLQGLHPLSIPDAVDRVLARLDLTEESSTTCSALSGGTFRRVALAASLVGDPPILLLDEPTTSLDPVQRVKLRRLIKEVSVDRTTIVATHLMEDVAEIANWIVVLNATRVVFEGPPEALAGSVAKVSEALGSSLEAAIVKIVEGSDEGEA